MSKHDELLALFREVAEALEHRTFPDLTSDSPIADLGIDSLSVMQIVGELEDRLAIMIPEERLVAVTTVGDLLRVVESLQV